LFFGARQARSDGATVFAVHDSVLAREDFDAVLEAASFDRHVESQGKVVDVDAAFDRIRTANAMS
jgi:hypothetical protein